MSRVLGLLVVGWFAIAVTGCVGPMGAGCCGPSVGGACAGSSCDSCTGCGELYVDPWINNPADCVDPCDACGNHNGQSCGKCRSVFSGVGSLWGYRCGCDPGPGGCTDRQFAPRCASGCDVIGCDGGCTSCVSEPACGCEGSCDCGGYVEPGCGFEPSCGLEPACGCEGGCSCGGGIVSDYSSHPGEYVVESPSNVRPAPVAEKPYKPQRTRKIFNPRTETARGFLNEYHR